MIIWSLFDSGNGCYSKVFNAKPGVKNISIGIDKERGNNSNHLNLNLADISPYFGGNDLIDELEKLPKPDVIIASPPCESWSIASAMKEGNACWNHKKGNSFTIRKKSEYNNSRYNMNKSFYNRINGEVTVYNLIKIIKHFNPKIYIIENPSYGKIWEYIDEVLDFNIKYENLTFYNNYGYTIKKPTKFKSNVNLNLNKESHKPGEDFRKMSTKGGKYNKRSNIPEKLIEKIYEEIKNNIDN
jgi:hypothetical protein